MGRVSRYCAAGAAAVLLIAACGDGGDEPQAEKPAAEVTNDAAPTSPPSDEAVEGCTLVTEDDAVRILGEDFTGEESDVDDDPVMAAECVWTNVAEDHGAHLQFRIFKQAALYQEEAYAGEEGFEEVSGFGDDAYAVSTDTSVMLDLLIGDQVLQFDASKGGGGFDPAATLAELKLLAERVLSELRLF